MDSPLIIRGKFSHQTFVPDGLLPEVEGRAELIVYIQPDQAEAASSSSFLDFAGKAPNLRSAQDIDAQLHDEKEAWNEE